MNRYYVFKFKALMCEHLCVFEASVPIALHLQASTVVTFNGLNYIDWSEYVQFYLDILDLKLSLLTERPAVVTDESKVEKWSLYKG